MIKLVPEHLRRDLSMAIAKGEFDGVRKIIEVNRIDADSFIDTEAYKPIIMEALLSYGIKNEADRLVMLRYLLEKGANPNTNCKSGYNCLHIAVQREKLAKALDLFLDFNADVNITDTNGANIIYWSIECFPWRTEGEERAFHLNLMEKILMLGADLDQQNKFGVTPRKWLQHKPEDVKQLVDKCEKLKPVYQPSRILQPEFPTSLQYPEIAKKIWKELVPPRGQADTVQGELLRAIEKLRDEAQRNGNINYYESHKLLAKFILETLTNSGIFDRKELSKIKTETKKLMKASEPYIADDAYDYLTDMICIFYLKSEEPIRHESDPQIIY